MVYWKRFSIEKKKRFSHFLTTFAAKHFSRKQDLIFLKYSMNSFWLLKKFFFFFPSFMILLEPLMWSFKERWAVIGANWTSLMTKTFQNFKTLRSLDTKEKKRKINKKISRLLYHVYILFELFKILSPQRFADYCPRCTDLVSGSISRNFCDWILNFKNEIVWR